MVKPYFVEKKIFDYKYGVMETKYDYNFDDTFNTTNIINQKPDSIIDYNKYMKRVDRADQYLLHYSVLKKIKKWINWVVIFN